MERGEVGPGGSPGGKVPEEVIRGVDGGRGAVLTGTGRGDARHVTPGAAVFGPDRAREHGADRAAEEGAAVVEEPGPVGGFQVQGSVAASQVVTA